jgi:hypothetical protein
VSSSGWNRHSSSSSTHYHREREAYLRRTRRPLRWSRCKRPHLELLIQTLPARSAIVPGVLLKPMATTYLGSVARPASPTHSASQHREAGCKGADLASRFLTLQGAVAHSDMPIESGPTRLLPFSQKFEKGYMAYRIPEFQNYFLETLCLSTTGEGRWSMFQTSAILCCWSKRLSGRYALCETLADLFSVRKADGNDGYTLAHRKDLGCLLVLYREEGSVKTLRHSSA